MDTRGSLISAAIDIFATSGYEAASVREIERQAGVNRGLVAYHFGSKEELWKASVEWLMQEFHDEMTRQREALRDVSPRERGRVLLKVFVRFHAHHPEYTRLLVSHGNDRSPQMRWLVDQYLRRNDLFFRTMIESPELPSGEEAILRFIMVGAASMVFAVPAQCELLYGVDPLDHDFIERFADVIADLFMDLPTTGLPGRSLTTESRGSA